MKNKLLCKGISFLLALVIITSLIPSVFAVSDNGDNQDFAPGVVEVVIKAGSPEVKEVFKNFEITDVVSLKLMSGYVENKGYDTLYNVFFKENTKDIVEKAVSELRDNENIVSINPRYYKKFVPEHDMQYAIGGYVSVCVRSCAPDFQQMLPDIEIESSSEYARSNDNWIWYALYLKDKNIDVVVKAIDELLKQPYVNIAQPGYDVYFVDIEDEKQEEEPTPVSDFAPGVVEVVVKAGSPDVKEVFKNFEITDVVRLKLMSGYVENKGYDTLYNVFFKENTKEIVEKAVSELKDNENIVSINPRYYKKFVPEHDMKFAFRGYVSVCVRSCAPDFQQMLPDIEIESVYEYERSNDNWIWYALHLKDNDIDVVVKAIDELLKQPYVNIAQPGYEAYVEIENEKLEKTYIPGIVFVELKSDSPSIYNILNGFEITNATMLNTRPENTSKYNSYRVELADKTYEATKRAVQVLQESPYVVGIGFEYMPTIEPEIPEIPEEKEYVPGVVIVEIKNESPNFDAILPGFDITKFLLLDKKPDTGKDNNRYRVELADKSYENTQRAVQVLKESPYVVKADFEYIPEYKPVEGVPDIFVILKDEAPSIDEIMGNIGYSDAKLIAENLLEKVYEVTLTQRTNKGISQALDALNSNRYVKAAEPYAGFEGIISPVYPVKGDADGDGELSILDATMIQRYLAGMLDSSAVDVKASNVSGTGMLCIRDVTLIQRNLAQLSSW